MRLPAARGPLSHALFAGLRDEGPLPRRAVAQDADDLQIGLWALYELHYRGFEDVDERFEWDPETLAVRGRLEQTFETQLRGLTSALTAAALDEDGVAAQLERIV